MRLFKSRDGRYIEPRQHIAYFKGDNNRSKSKVLLFLHYQLGKGLQGLFTAKELHNETGVPYAYLASRLKFWYNIRYLNRKPVDTGQGRPVFAYSIDERGIHFVEDRIPIDKRNEYVEEINSWRQNNK